MRKYSKKLLGLLLAASVFMTGSGFSGFTPKTATAADDAQRNTTNVVTDGKLTDSNLTEEHLSANGIKTKDNGLMRANLSSIDLMKLEGMGLGWNLGNQMEEANLLGIHKTVEECEKNAGNPVATQKTFDGLKKTGVNTVRVPVAWSNFMEEVKQADGSTYYKISDDLMDRVEEIINYALNNEMYVIINIHWDGGWWGRFGAEEWDGTPLKDTDPAKNPIRYGAYKKYTDIWKQLSERYKEYSDRLIFEGANEELSGRLNDDYTDPGKAQTGQTGKLPQDGDQIYKMVNEINQTFVDIVRASGGNNAYRQLLIPGTGNESCVIGGYPGDHYVNDGTVDERYVLPKDPAEELTGSTKMSVSVHFYDPTDYGISATSTTPWGYRDNWGTDADKKQMEESLNRLEKFTSKNYGIILGECGCVKGYKDGVIDYEKTLFTYALEKGMCPVWWDEGHYYDREHGYWSYADVGQVYMDMNGITLDPVKDKAYINPKPVYTGVKAVPITKNQSPKVVATWEGEFMRHTNAETADILLQTRPNDITKIENASGGVEIGIGNTTKTDNLEAKIDVLFWNISVKTDWSKIKEPCVRVYPMDNEISQNADLQLGYIGAYKATDKAVINGKVKAGDPKGNAKYDVDYDPGTNSLWNGKYVQLDKEALKEYPWLWVTTNTYTGASYVKIEICDAAYNADGTEYGKPATPAKPKVITKKMTKSVKAGKSIKVKVRSKSSEKAKVKVAKKSIAKASLKGKNVVIKGKKKGTTVVTVTTKTKIYKITVKVKKLN